MDTNDTDDVPAEGKPMKKKLLMIAGPVLLLIAGMFLGKTFFGGGGDPAPVEDPATEVEAAEGGGEGADTTLPEAPPRTVATVVELPAPEHVEPLAPLSLNLAGGHYMRVGLSVGLVTVETEDGEGGGGHGGDKEGGLDPALAAEMTDALISHISGRPVTDFATAEDRDVLRDELLESFHELSHGAVVEVYFTEFVTQ